MRTFVSTLFLLAAFTSPLSLPAGEPVPGGIWDRESAVQIIELADTGERRAELRGAVLAGDETAVLALLESTASDPLWPAPVRESVLFQFAQELKHLPASTVPPAVTAFLRSYRPQVRVAHEDHSTAAVPLFNIPAAAWGAEHLWLREESAYTGARLLARDPQALVERYRAERRGPARSGLIDALDQAGAHALEEVALGALAVIEQQPDLFRLAASAALRANDAPLLRESLRHGDGPALARLLRATSGILPRADTHALLVDLLEHLPPAAAAVALAELAPLLADHTASQELLVALLAEPMLGSSAALALATTASHVMLARLRDLAAADPASLTARRAALALQLHRLQPPRGVDP